MELWVRSQDKEALMKVNNGVLYHQTEDMRDCIVIKESPSYYHIIGAYKTKERTLEVLDEIQDKLNIKHSDGAGAEFIVLNEIVPIIYEMPEY